MGRLFRPAFDILRQVNSLGAPLAKILVLIVDAQRGQARQLRPGATLKGQPLGCDLAPVRRSQRIAQANPEAGPRL